ncbi:MAG: hypothetical protein WD738_19695 [Pirellulales bacterium]
MNLLIDMPHWCFALFARAMSALVWIERPWRFSLRTMLIATAIVAAALVVIVAISR